MIPTFIVTKENIIQFMLAQSTRIYAVKQWDQLLLLTPKFKEICDCRHKKFSQAVIKKKQSRKVSLKPGTAGILFSLLRSGAVSALITP